MQFRFQKNYKKFFPRTQVILNSSFSNYFLEPYFHLRSSTYTFSDKVFCEFYEIKLKIRVPLQQLYVKIPGGISFLLGLVQYVSFVIVFMYLARNGIRLMFENEFFPVMKISKTKIPKGKIPKFNK